MKPESVKTTPRTIPWPLERAQIIKKHIAAMEQAQQEANARVAFARQEGAEGAMKMIAEPHAKAAINYGLEIAKEELARAIGNKVKDDVLKYVLPAIYARCKASAGVRSTLPDAVVLTIDMKPWQLHYCCAVPMPPF